jgi:hypothetical protein
VVFPSVSDLNAATYKTGECHSLLILGIGETVTGMENGHIVYILHVALLKISRYTESLTQKVQGIESFGLGLGDRW